MLLHPPWNSTVQPLRESQLTLPSPDGDTFSSADKLLLSCLTLYIISVFRLPELLLCGMLNNTTEIVKRPHQTLESLQMQSPVLLGVTMSRQNSLHSSSRHNQEQLFLFILLQTRRLCKGRFTQATWLVHYRSTTLLCYSCKVTHTHSIPCYSPQKAGT